MKEPAIPASVHADAIYRNRDNLNFCKIHGIRLSGPKLGCPPKVVLAKDKKFARQDARDRIPVEGAFGVAKRRYSLGLIRTRLQETSESVIAIHFHTELGGSSGTKPLPGHGLPFRGR